MDDNGDGPWAHRKEKPLCSVAMDFWCPIKHSGRAILHGWLFLVYQEMVS